MAFFTAILNGGNTIGHIGVCIPYLYSYPSSKHELKSRGLCKEIPIACHKITLTAKHDCWVLANYVLNVRANFTCTQSIFLKLFFFLLSFFLSLFQVVKIRWDNFIFSCNFIYKELIMGSWICKIIRETHPPPLQVHAKNRIHDDIFPQSFGLCKTNCSNFCFDNWGSRKMIIKRILLAARSLFIGAHGLWLKTQYCWPQISWCMLRKQCLKQS